ncbi:MAG: 23S rRNA (guanosine(2251)-2'-O)-methyltransferase RlmB [Mesorhizobium amorphae]|nr:MAG: 23S rRNA (guanosine(2251)-2'-O)-methyltransferase RlmB [Mesorhizobium amorphae]
MNDKPGTPKDSHYARLRRAHRDVAAPRQRPKTPGEAAPAGALHLYGIHTVQAALDNPRRVIRKLWLTRNAAERLSLPASPRFGVETAEPRALDKLVGSDAVHQGVVAEAEPLRPKPLGDLGEARLILVLDQVTDPHNVGAILRSAVAFGAAAVVTTARHSPEESGVLAKAASGALEHIDQIEVRNLAEALGTLHEAGFHTVGLDSDGPAELEASLSGSRIALVLGAEGKGLRQKTRETVSALARLDMPGAIRSLNVSNAAAVSLYVAQSFLKR